MRRLIKTTFGQLGINDKFRFGDSEFDRIYTKLSADQCRPNGDNTILERIKPQVQVYIEVTK